MELAGSLTSLRSALSQARFPLALPDRAAAQTTIHQIVSQLDDYVLPRLRSKKMARTAWTARAEHWVSPRLPVLYRPDEGMAGYTEFGLDTLRPWQLKGR